MAMGRVEAISRSYQESMASTSGLMDWVILGMVALVIILVGGYYVSNFFKRRRLAKRKKQRMKR